MGYLPDNSEDRDKLLDEIARLESVGAGVEKPKLPSTKLDEITYAPPTDDELRAEAERGLSEYKDKEIEAIKASSAENEKALVGKRDTYKEQREDELDKLSAAYASAADAVDADVIKRGLARSTIAVNKKGELTSDHAKAAADVESSYGKLIAGLEAEISATQSKLNTALNDFNLSYATKLAQKIDELKDERDKRVEEVTKYNNDVRAKQATLDADRLKTESSLYSDALSQSSKLDLDSLSKEKREAIYKSVYEKMDAYLSGLSKDKAKQELRNHALYRDHLSDYYYYKLYDKYGR